MKREGFFRSILSLEIVFVVTAVVLFSACAGMVGTAAYKPKSIEEGYVIQTVKTMVEALNDNDVPLFMSKVSTGYYGGYVELEERLKEALDRCLEFFIEATVENISFEEPKVAASVTWRSVHLTRSASGKEEIKGRTQLIFKKGEMGIKLIDYSGDPLPGFEQ